MLQVLAVLQVERKQAGDDREHAETTTAPVSAATGLVLEHGYALRLAALAPELGWVIEI